MTYSNNEICLMVYNDQELNQSIINLIPPGYRDDFKSHLSLTILNLNNKELNRIIKKKEIKYYIIRIILNLNSNKSPFYKIYRNNGMPLSQKTSEYIPNTQTPEETYEEDNFQFRSDLIDELLKSQHWYHQVLFKLYREGKTYKDIERLTGIRYQSVRLSILKTIDELKQKIKIL